MFGIYDMVCNYSSEVVSLIDLLEQQRSVMVGESLSCSYGELMTDMQALEESQQ